MRTVSLTLHMPMYVTVHNQHSGIELTSPVCFCDGRIYDEYSVERSDGGAVMKVGLRFGLLDKLPGGILMCRVQRNRNAKCDYQSSTDTTFIGAADDTSKIMRLLVTWKINRSWKFNVRIILVGHDDELVLNEDKLAQLYDKVNDIPSDVYDWILKYDGIYKEVWLMNDNTVLVTTNDAIYEIGCELKITISEGAKDKDAESAFWIDSARQVSSDGNTLYANLNCSLILQSTTNVTINNRCSNIELTSPVYFTKDNTCHTHLPQQVDSKSEIKVKFKAGINQDTFGGVLLYRLQWKEDVSTGTQLLVIWGCKSDNLYSHVRLIEHESTLTWNEDKLKILYDVYNSQYNMDVIIEKWLLDDNTKLKTKYEISRGGLEINIIISEEKDMSSHAKPLWIDSEK
jgi:hypothetical protein